MLFRGIHADALNQWLISLSENKDRILSETYMASRYSILEEIARGINGIGRETIDSTIAMIEDCIGKDRN